MKCKRMCWTAVVLGSGD